MVVLSLSLPRPVPSGYHRLFDIHVFHGFVQRFDHHLWVVFLKGEEKLPWS